MPVAPEKSPLPLNYALSSSGHPRPFALVGIAATTIAFGAVIGASTNAINGAISPTYFLHVLGWYGVADVWRASIAQGIFEGLIVGLGMAIIFTTTIGIISRATCRYTLALRYLVGIVLVILGLWAVGGLIAVGLAALSPEFYRKTFIAVPSDFHEMLRYAWVGGSIWGAELGGLLSVILGLVLFRAKWRRLVPPS